MKIDRLLLTKYLYEKGQEFLRRDDPYAYGLAVSLFHDAVESLLYYIALHVDGIKKSEKLLEYWQVIRDAPKNKNKKEVPLKLQMKQLNRCRVDFKHYGNLPAPLTARDHALNTEDFLRKSMSIFLGVDFDALSRADLIRDDRAKGFVKGAERYYSDGNYGECVSECAKAHKVIMFSIQEVFIKGKYFPSLKLVPTGNSNVDKNLDQLAKYFDRMSSYGLEPAIIIALQIRMADYMKFHGIIPNVLGPPGSVVQIRHKHLKYSSEDVEFCLKYITDEALLIQNRI